LFLRSLFDFLLIFYHTFFVVLFLLSIILVELISSYHFVFHSDLDPAACSLSG